LWPTTGVTNDTGPITHSDLGQWYNWNTTTEGTEYGDEISTGWQILDPEVLHPVSS